jgi:uncharacterized protein (TIGR01777 family)
MRIVIAGGTGFLGARLADSLAGAAADVVVLTRRSAARQGKHRQVRWDPDGTAGPWAAEVNGAAAVINLAGESIAGERWSADHKDRILQSRVRATRSLAAAIRQAATPPDVFLSGSAVGYYGMLDDHPVTETSPPGSDFLARVCVEWEKEAGAAADLTRVVLLRTGLVLAKDGGALPEMLLPFKLGAGGPVGSGRQYWPWIHRDDWIGLVSFAIATGSIVGPLNMTAPEPVTNREFASALGRAMHRPAFMPAPAFALRLMLGEMADALLLSGQRAIPAKAQKEHYAFRYSRVDDALQAIFEKSEV